MNVQEGGCFSIFRRADDVTRTMSKGGGGACECPRVGAFFKLMTSRGQCPRGGGGCAWCSTHPSSDPPPPPGWLATGLVIMGDVLIHDQMTVCTPDQHASLAYKSA